MRIEGYYSKAKYRGKVYDIYSNIKDDDLSLEIIYFSYIIIVFLYEVELLK